MVGTLFVARPRRLLEEVAVAPLVLFTPDAEEDDDGDDADHEQPRHEQQREGQLRDVVLVAQPLTLFKSPPVVRSGGLLLARLLGRRGRGRVADAADAAPLDLL